MKVKIGDYRTWIGPYQIADKIIWWADKWDDDDVWARRSHRLGRWLSKDRHGNDSWLAKACAWVHKNLQGGGERKVHIRIDDHDVYSADHTLALIILPILEKLKAHKHGSPMVDAEDLPKHLRLSKREQRVQQDGHWDKKLKASEEEQRAANDKFHAGWDWVLDEMIWAFQQHANGDWDGQFHSGKHDMLWQKVDVHGNAIGEPTPLGADRDDDDDSDGDAKHMYQMVKGPGDTWSYDREGAKRWSDRMANGRRLFAKYYESLWW